MAGTDNRFVPAIVIKLGRVTNLRSELDQLWKTFKESKNSPAAYRTYLLSLLAVVSEHPELDRVVAGYIAHTMFLDEVESNPAKEAIAQYAGELEAPTLSKGHRMKNWHAIAELAREI